MKKNKVKIFTTLPRNKAILSTTKEFTLAMFSLTLVFFLLVWSKIPQKALEFIE